MAFLLLLVGTWTLDSLLSRVMAVAITVGSNGSHKKGLSESPMIFGIFSVLEEADDKIGWDKIKLDFG
jgi:hypothetical protein